MTDRKTYSAKRITKQAIKKNTEFIALGTKTSARSSEKVFTSEFLKKNDFSKKIKPDSTISKNLSPLEIMDAIEQGNYDDPKNLITISIKSLIIQNDLDFLFPVIYSAKIFPNEFTSDEVVQLLRDLIKGDGPYAQQLTVVAINILLWSFNTVNEWPIFIMELYLEDFVSDDRWSDFNQCKGLVANLLTTFEPIHTTFQPSNLTDLPNASPFMESFQDRVNSIIPHNRYSHITNQVTDLVLNMLSRSGREPTPIILKLAGLAASYDSIKYFVSNRLDQWIQNPKLSCLAFEVFDACCSTKLQKVDSEALQGFIKNIFKIRIRIPHQLGLLENSFKKFLLVNPDSFVFVTNFIIGVECTSFRTLGLHLLSSCLVVSPDQSTDCVVSSFVYFFSQYSRSVVVNFTRDLLRLESFCDCFTIFYSKLVRKSTDLVFLSLFDQNNLEKYFNFIIDVGSIAMIVFTATNYSNYQAIVMQIQENALEWLQSVVTGLCSDYTSSAFLIWIKRIIGYDEISELIPHDCITETISFADITQMLQTAFLSEKSLEFLIQISAGSPKLMGPGALLQILYDFFVSNIRESSKSTNRAYFDVCKLLNLILNLTLYGPSNLNLKLFAVKDIYWNAWLLGLILTVFYSEQPLLVLDRFPTLYGLIELVISGPNQTEKIVSEEQEMPGVSTSSNIYNQEIQEVIEFESQLAGVTLARENGHLANQLTYFSPFGKKQTPPLKFRNILAELNKLLYLDYYVIRLNNYSFFVHFLEKIENISITNTMIDQAIKLDCKIVGILDTFLLISYLTFKVSHSTDNTGLLHPNMPLLVNLNARCCCSASALVHSLDGLLSSLSASVNSERLCSITVLDLVLTVNPLAERGSFLSQIASKYYFAECRSPVIRHLLKAIHFETSTSILVKYVIFLVNYINPLENEINSLTEWMLSRHTLFDLPSTDGLLVNLSNLYYHLCLQLKTGPKMPAFAKYEFFIVVVLFACYFPVFKDLMKDELIQEYLMKIELPEWLAVRVIRSPCEFPIQNFNVFRNISDHACVHMIISMLLSDDKMTMVLQNLDQRGAYIEGPDSILDLIEEIIRNWQNRTHLNVGSRFIEILRSKRLPTKVEEVPMHVESGRETIRTAVSWLTKLMDTRGLDKSVLVRFLTMHSTDQNILTEIFNAVNTLGMRFAEVIDEFDKDGLPSVSLLCVDVLFYWIGLKGWNKLVSELLTSSPMNSNFYKKIIDRLAKYGLDAQSFLSNGEIIDDEDEEIPAGIPMDLETQTACFTVDDIWSNGILPEDQGWRFGKLLSLGKLGELIKFGCQVVQSQTNTNHQQLLDFISEVLSRVQNLNPSELPAVPRLDYIFWHILSECKHSNSVEPIYRCFPLILKLIEFGEDVGMLKLCISEIPCTYSKNIYISKAYTSFPSYFPPVIAKNAVIPRADSFLRRLIFMLSTPETGLKAKNRMQKASLICKKIGKVYPTLLLHYMSLLSAIIAGRGNFTFNELTSKHHYHFFAHVIGLVDFVMSLPFEVEVGAVCSIFDAFIVLINTQLETKNPQGINGIKSIVVKLISLVKRLVCVCPAQSRDTAVRALQCFRSYVNVVSKPQRVIEDIIGLEISMFVEKGGPHYLPVLSRRLKNENKKIAIPSGLNLSTETCYKKLVNNLISLDELSRRKLDVLDRFQSELMGLYQNSTKQVRKLSARLISRYLTINPNERIAREFIGQKISHGIFGESLNLPEMMTICGDSSAELVRELCDLFIRKGVAIDLGNMIRMNILKFND